MSALPPIADICECLAIERERGSVEADLLWALVAVQADVLARKRGSSDVISAAFNVEFHFDAFGPRVGNQRCGNDLAYAELFGDVF